MQTFSIMSIWFKFDRLRYANAIDQCEYSYK